MNQLKRGQKRATILSAGITLVDLPTPNCPSPLQKTTSMNQTRHHPRRHGHSLAKDFQNLSQLDSQIAYLTSDEKQNTPLARRWM